MYRRSGLGGSNHTLYTSIFCIAFVGESQQELVNRHDSAITYHCICVGGRCDDARRTISIDEREHSARSLLLSLSASNKKLYKK
jgi:hypothetical protein